jgi:hypothetical protein
MPTWVVVEGTLIGAVAGAVIGGTLMLLGRAWRWAVSRVFGRGGRHH